VQSRTPMEGSPWPHDMVISVVDDPLQLTQLLWVREALALDPPGKDLPPLLLDTPAVTGEPEDRAAWETAWPEIWRAALAHAAGPNPAGSFARLQDMADGSPERAALHDPVPGGVHPGRRRHCAIDDSADA